MSDYREFEFTIGTEAELRSGNVYQATYTARVTEAAVRELGGDEGTLDEAFAKAVPSLRVYAERKLNKSSGDFIDGVILGVADLVG